MEEIKIEIECLQSLKEEIQIAITKPTEYGRWPSDNDFLALQPLLSKLVKTQAKIDTLNEVLIAIESNTLIFEKE